MPRRIRADKGLPLLFILFLTLTLWSQDPGTVTAIRAGRMFDSVSGELLQDQIILIEGERIKGVGDAGSLKIPSGARVVDLSQATVLPGLIDAHTHLFIYSAPKDSSYKGLENFETNAQLFNPFMDQLFESAQFRRFWR